jgi:hypothetical protein
MSINISKRTAIAFAHARLYCTQNFISCTKKHEHKQHSYDLFIISKTGFKDFAALVIAIVDKIILVIMVINVR